MADVPVFNHEGDYDHHLNYDRPFISAFSENVWDQKFTSKNDKDLLIFLNDLRPDIEKHILAKLRSRRSGIKYNLAVQFHLKRLEHEYVEYQEIKPWRQCHTRYLLQKEELPKLLDENFEKLHAEFSKFLREGSVAGGQWLNVFSCMFTALRIVHLELPAT